MVNNNGGERALPFSCLELVDLPLGEEEVGLYTSHLKSDRYTKTVQSGMESEVFRHWCRNPEIIPGLPPGDSGLSQ